jgi:hypothetical protein
MLILLKCVAEGRRLRVRILSPGYFSEANCQFPRNLRAEGRFYQVDSTGITLASGPAGKFFYRVRGDIKIVDDLTQLENIQSVVKQELQVSVEQVFDSGTVECVVCLEDPKTLVMVPCGHYCLCATCKTKIFKCPLCRQAITLAVTTDQIS